MPRLEEVKILDSNNDYLRFCEIKYRKDSTSKDTNSYYMVTRNKPEDMAALRASYQDYSVKSNGIVIAPYFEDSNELLFIREYRPAINSFEYGFPAGLIEEGENIEEAIIRELAEETGLEVLSTEKILGAAYDSIGISDEAVSIYLAKVTGSFTNENTVGKEIIESAIKVKLEDVADFIENNIIGTQTALSSLYIVEKFKNK